MRVSLKWLKDYVDFDDSIDSLADKLTMTGLEVEEVETVGSPLDQVVVGKILDINPHPNADKLFLCSVTDGKDTFELICGAPNATVGVLAALALPGAVLPNGMKIKTMKIRGVKSTGMLCAEDELGLSDDHTGIILFDPQTPLGTPIGPMLDSQDHVLEIGVTPNRPDCLSIIGIAREIAAIYGSKLKFPEITLTEDGPPIEELASIEILSPENCPRYAARVVQNIEIKHSPRWMYQRLTNSGIRSINNVVDVTNFILLELGQPMHAFDFDFLREHKIVVKQAEDGEKFVTLDEMERSLDSSNLMICDGAGSVALAGVMGGLNSEIKDESNAVLLESAYFSPVSIRRTSSSLKLSTEASYRFERGIDPDGAVRAADRAADLIQKTAGGQIAKGVIDKFYPEQIPRYKVKLRASKTNRVLGTEISKDRMKQLLTSIDLPCRDVDDDTLEITPPGFRPDISREIDLVEEVARLHGFEKIPETLPDMVLTEKSSDQRSMVEERAKQFLASRGLTEVVNYSFVSSRNLQWMRLADGDPMLNYVPLKNPMSEEINVMRTSLIPGLMLTAERNLNFGADGLKIFELGKVFLKKEDDRLADEPLRLSGLLLGEREDDLWPTGPAEMDFYDLKGVLEDILDFFRIENYELRMTKDIPYLTPGIAGEIWTENELLGVFGQIHPAVRKEFNIEKNFFIFELHFDNILKYSQVQISFQSLPRFPAMFRDLALLVDKNISNQQIIDLIYKADSKYLVDVKLFDFYEGKQIPEGKKSLAYHLIYQNPNKTLTENKVRNEIEKVVKLLEDTLGISVRQ